MSREILILGLALLCLTQPCAADRSRSHNPTGRDVRHGARKDPKFHIRGNATVCYKDLGCFSNQPPFDNALGILPDTPEVVEPRFLLYTRRGGPVILDYRNPKSLNGSGIDFRLETKFIIHGFANSPEKSPWVGEMRNVFLSTGDYNVIELGWNTKFPNYLQAVANTRLVGMATTKLLEIMTLKGLDLGKLHLLGHSLGAHICGYAGQAFAGKIARISGLDPAGPAFATSAPAVRLDPTDARFVDVIHSNGHPMDMDGGFGMLLPCGHVDFYPNGGKKQPGCLDGVKGAVTNFFKDIFAGKVDNLTLDTGEGIGCSHGRSHEIFLESINSSSCMFVAQPCRNYENYTAGLCRTCGPKGCNSAGLQADRNKEGGLQYFETLATPRFCVYPYLVTIEPVGSPKHLSGQLTFGIHGEHSANKTTTVIVQGDIAMAPGKPLKRLAMFDTTNTITRVSLAYKREHWLSRRKFFVARITLEPLQGGQKYETASEPFIVVSGSLTTKAVTPV